MLDTGAPALPVLLAGKNLLEKKREVSSYTMKHSEIHPMNPMFNGWLICI
jgi:hypothetical protein